MEQINHHDDEHDQSSNEENTHDDHQQLLFKYLAESLQKQQQQQSGPIDFSVTSHLIKKEILDDGNDDGVEDTATVKAFCVLMHNRRNFHFIFSARKRFFLVASIINCNDTTIIAS